MISSALPVSARPTSTARICRATKRTSAACGPRTLSGKRRIYEANRPSKTHFAICERVKHAKQQPAESITKTEPSRSRQSANVAASGEAGAKAHKPMPPTSERARGAIRNERAPRRRGALEATSATARKPTASTSVAMSRHSGATSVPMGKTLLVSSQLLST